MIHEFDSFDAYHEACQQDPSLRGFSPGGARSRLGITRQGVYSAVQRGSLDMVRIMENGTGPYLIITEASMERYRPKQGKPGPLPGFRQRLQNVQDRLIAGVWPVDR